MSPLPSLPCRARRAAALAVALASLAGTVPAAPAAPAGRPALAVSLIRPQRASLPTAVVAHGNVAAWQEAIVGAEAPGLRLAELRAQVGDRVRRGQVLAVFDARMARAELAQAEAALAEAEAALAEAAADARRARELEGSGALSEQQRSQLLTAAQTAQARRDALKAARQVQQLRVRQAEVRAPDDGVISARSATVGAVMPAGSELFRLIRRGRLEWRGEVAAAELAAIRPGMAVQVQPPSGPPVAGTVRQLAPTLDPGTRNALVYVDLPESGGRLRAGMFARGEIVTGSRPALTLPLGTVLLREGFSLVFVVGEDGRVLQRKVRTGRRSGEQVEILDGLDEGTRVVARGAAFLADGDLVRVVEPGASAP